MSTVSRPRGRAREASVDGRLVTSGAAAARPASSPRRPRARRSRGRRRSASRRARAAWCRTRRSGTAAARPRPGAATESAIAPQSQRFVNRWWKALVRSERALKQLKSWARTSVVNAIVRASSSLPEPPTIPPGRRRSSASSVTTAITSADPEDADPHLGVDHPVGEPARRPAHHVVGRRVHAQRERRRAVGEQVDPEDLRREQRHRDRLAGVLEAERAREHDAEEHRQHLADVRREQEAQELADVREDAAALADRARRSWRSCRRRGSCPPPPSSRRCR